MVYYVKPIIRAGAETPDFMSKQNVDPETGVGFESAYEAVMWAKVVQTHPDVIGTQINPDVTSTT
jgi:hypothetical protein